MDTVTEKLTEVRALLEKGWTSGTLARNAADEVVEVDSPDACKWCLLGGLYRVTDDEQMQLLAYNTLLPYADGVTYLSTFNDERGHEAVLKLLDDTIAGEKAGREE